MDPALVKGKFKLLFAKMKEPGYVMNKYYADGLINKLAHGEDIEIMSGCTLSLLSDLIVDGLENAETRHLSVRVFLTRMLAVMAQKEVYFTRMFSKRENEILKGFKEINSPTMNPSLRVAYMEVAIAIVSHESGISWLLEKEVWKEILSLSNAKQTVFVVRQIYKFASALVWQLNDLGDEAKLRLIICYIIKPANEIDLLNLTDINLNEEESLCNIFEPMLQIILSIVTLIPKIQKPNLVVTILTKEYVFMSRLHIIIDRVRRDSIVLLGGKLGFWILIAKMFLSKPAVPDLEYLPEDTMELTAMYFNMIQRFVVSGSVDVILDYCTSCNVIWMTICKATKMKHTQGSQNLLFMCLVPTLIYIHNITRHKKFHCEDNNESLKGYIEKMLNSTCEHTARAAYAFRDLMMELDIVSITIQSVKKLTCLKNLLNDEQANLVFQGLFYILSAFDPTAEDETSSCEDNQEKVLVLSYVLDIVNYLVKNHNINWHASLEVICLYTIVYNILQRPNLSSNFIVTALNVIATTVKKFLPPNLSLLMESKPGSSMHELGRLIYMKMHDMHWEVRDSALELLLACTEICYVKFPPFQKQILENNLINVAATLAFNDHEFYVQASALKCVGAASKVSAVWDHLTAEYPNIQDQLISIISNNQEGIVRKEACNVLCEIYQNISTAKLPPTFKHTLYDHMVSSALSDFHWEVQLSALKFWMIVIQSLLNDQGMLDGTFPPVTFSRETRKIVTLNEAEIQKRLLRILDELASIGCLTVLVKLLHEDTEVDIMEPALCISSGLIDILNKYNVPDVIKQTENEVNCVDELLSDVHFKENSDQAMVDTEIEAKSEKVIEGIVNADDINLLSNIYERHMNLQSNKEENVTPKIKLVKRASPYLFVNHVKNGDYKAIIEYKKKWKDGIRSIPSLLDDVLGIYYETNEDVNTLDCY